MLWSRHQLLRLHPSELGKGSVWGFIAPNPLTGRKHLVAAIALFFISIILVAMGHFLVASHSACDIVADRPNDSRGIGCSDMIISLVHVKWADGYAQTSPETVVIHLSGHHQNRHALTV